MIVTRREILIGALAAGALFRTRTASAQTSTTVTPVSFNVPAGACDCHTHIHGDPATFPFFAGRVYTPEIALPEELSALHKTLHVQRVVIVTPSVYGTDNSATLYGMKARGADARGVAVIDDKTPESDARGHGPCRRARHPPQPRDRRHQRPGRSGTLALPAAAERVSGRNWHVQMNTSLPMIAAIKDVVAASPVPVVFDHFGGAQAELGVKQPGFADLVSWCARARPTSRSPAPIAPRSAPDYADVAPLAKALIAANPDRVLWGTDWPHPDPVTPPGRKPTEVTPMLQIDDGRAAESAAGVGARCSDAQEDPGGQPRAALRVLTSDEHRSVSSVSERVRVFRQLHEAGCFVIPNPWDLGSARVLARLGFAALATTSSGFAWSLGRPDNHVTLDEALGHIRSLAHGVDIPINADFEGGFAIDPAAVAGNVARAAATGVAGLSIEDSTGDTASPLVDFTLSVERIRAARRALDDSGTGVLLTARSEGFIVGRPDLAETIRRLTAYAEAGAECLYAPGSAARRISRRSSRRWRPSP